MCTKKQTPWQKSVCQQLNFHFKKTGWTQNRLSLESGVSEGRISEYLSGSENPSLKTIEKLANALRVTATKFFRSNKFNRLPRR